MSSCDTLKQGLHDDNKNLCLPPGKPPLTNEPQGTWKCVAGEGVAGWRGGGGFGELNTQLKSPSL